MPPACIHLDSALTSGRHTHLCSISVQTGCSRDRSRLAPPWPRCADRCRQRVVSLSTVFFLLPRVAAVAVVRRPRQRRHMWQCPSSWRRRLRRTLWLHVMRLRRKLRRQHRLHLHRRRHHHKDWRHVSGAGLAYLFRQLSSMVRCTQTCRCPGTTTWPYFSASCKNARYRENILHVNRRSVRLSLTASSGISIGAITGYMDDGDVFQVHRLVGWRGQSTAPDQQPDL
jgi:hypothetical protein